jgi:hypothetical protein
MKRPIIHALALLVLMFRCALCSGTSSTARPPLLQKAQTREVAGAVVINELFTYFRNNGIGGQNPYTGDVGLELKSNGSQIMFSEGLVWGGYSRGTVKLGGASFTGGLQAGPIIAPGTPSALPVAANSANSRYRVYRVRPDLPYGVSFAQMESLLTSQELPYLTKYQKTLTARDLFDQYNRDWSEWPGAEGAPYTDVNHNGSYEPSIDIPGVPGADQTLWYVANDMDSVLTKALYGSLPIGIEMQRTLWAYKRSGALSTTIFQRSRLINKSGAPIDSMYLTQFSDPDLGGPLADHDDFVGCDTLRNLGYIYNTRSTDMDGAPQTPAAMGFALLAGPAVPGAASDSAFVNFSYRRGLRNLPMTSMVYILKNADEPHSGSYNEPAEFYNKMKGLFITGDPVINPETMQRTMFVFPGDPITQTGWVDGEVYKLGWPALTPSDRRMCITSGPFTMAPADTQDIIIAEIVGVGADNLGGISALRSNTDAVKKIFDNGFKLPSSPVAPSAKASGWDKRVLIEWTDPAAYAAAEAFASRGYTFQGYNFYQLPNGDFTKATRIFTSDIIDGVQRIVDTVYDPGTNSMYPKTEAYGTDSGIRRYFIAATDSLTGQRMVNGTKLWYAVTSYAYNAAASGGTRMIESAPLILEVTPQQPLPGVTLPALPGQIISRDKSRERGTDAGAFWVVVGVIDPSKLTGHTYSLSFADKSFYSPWSVFDSTARAYVIKDQTQYSAVYTGMAEYENGPTDPIADGLQFSVSSGYGHYPFQWSISTAGLEPQQFSSQKAAADVQRINVYPNPYFAGNTQESNKYGHFVTFNHLPQKAVINIHALNGVRVRVIVKDDASQFLKWDLTNDSGAQVAAGMYVVYISLPDLGTQKVLKLAVITAATVPDHW